MHKITVSHDGTLTREGAKIMRANGVAGVTGQTTLTQARAAARKAGASFEFVNATRPGKVAKAKRTRKIAPAVSTKRTVKAWACDCTTLTDHLSARCSLKA
jgi:hypothetical protein